MWSAFSSGLAFVLRPSAFLFMVFGTFMGVVIGALPGLSGSTGIILLLPLVYRLPKDVALVMLCGLFCGSMYGGSIAAILINTPGTPSASATVLDGYPMCLEGKAGKALGISAVSSFIGGLVSSICLIMIAPQLAKIALKFQAPDYFALSLFGLTIMASTDKDVVKGLISGMIGLLISTVGVDDISGMNRFTFGSMQLLRGFQLLPVLIGVFALSEVMMQLESGNERGGANTQRIGRIWPTREDFKGFWMAALVGSAIGVFIGIIPGTGGSIACFLAYNVAKRLSKDPERFGKGAMEGVAAPEAANNGTTGGALIPMLCLGIPGDVVTSVMLGALILIGVRPGPQLFTESPDIVYAIFAGMFVIQFLMLGMGMVCAKYSPAILKVPAKLLMPIIAVLCIVGSYSLGNNLFDVRIALIFGVVGFFMKKFKYPGAPLVLGVILGPIAEQNLNRALLISHNNYAVFFTRPISLMFLIFSVVSVAVSLRNASQRKHSS